MFPHKTVLVHTKFSSLGFPTFFILCSDLKIKLILSNSEKLLMYTDFHFLGFSCSAGTSDSWLFRKETALMLNPLPGSSAH